MSGVSSDVTSSRWAKCPREDGYTCRRWLLRDLVSTARCRYCVLDPSLSEFVLSDLPCEHSLSCVEAVSHISEVDLSSVFQRSSYAGAYLTPRLWSSRQVNSVFGRGRLMGCFVRVRRLALKTILSWSHWDIPIWVASGLVFSSDWRQGCSDEAA